jgi:hypothetical protein
VTRLARWVAPLSLLATLGAPLLFCAGALSEPAMKQVLLIATVTWFLSAPRWMRGGDS